MAKKKEEFETEEQAAESIAATNILGKLEPQAQEDVVASVTNNPVSVKEPEPAESKQTSDNENESDIKVNDSGIFEDVLNIKRQEIKSKKVNFLLTETNFNHLVELSEKTGASRNEIINRLINSCYQNANL